MFTLNTDNRATSVFFYDYIPLLTQLMEMERGTINM